MISTGPEQPERAWMLSQSFFQKIRGQTGTDPLLDPLLDDAISVQHGGLLCDTCLHEDPKAEPAAPDMLQLLEHLSDVPQPIMLERPVATALHTRLEDFLRWRLERPLKTRGVTVT